VSRRPAAGEEGHLEDEELAPQHSDYPQGLHVLHEQVGQRPKERREKDMRRVWVHQEAKEDGRCLLRQLVSHVVKIWPRCPPFVLCPRHKKE
jgi:hypothetical protein